jgi:hypothetical protein
MKLIFGGFPDRQVQQIMQAWEDARSRGITTMLIPYFGETPVQMIDTNYCTKSRRTSIHAHRGKPWVKARL